MNTHPPSSLEPAHDAIERRFPTAQLWLSLSITMLVLLALIFEIFQAKNQQSQASLRAIQLCENQYNCRYYVEAMCMSGYMALASGDPVWRSRFHQFLDRILTSVRSSRQKLNGDEAIVREMALLEEKIDTMGSGFLRAYDRQQFEEARSILDGLQPDELEREFVRFVDLGSTHQYIERLIDLNSQILEYDEARTMATNIAAVTGDLSWRKVYDLHADRLQAALSEADQLVTDSYIKEQTIVRIRAANNVLMNWEQLAFDNIVEGQRVAVQSIFQYDTYLRHKEIYANGISELTNFLHRRSAELIRKQSEPQRIQLATTIAAFFFLLGLWFFLSKAVKQWKEALTIAAGESRKAEAAIREANELLEQRVRDRTQELETALNEKHRLNLQLQQAQKMESLGRVAGGIAHDFNNLLVVINGNSELLLDYPNTAEEREQYVRQIYAAGRNAANLTRQLLAFSRQQVLRPTRINLNDVVHEVNRMLERLMHADVRIVTNLTLEVREVMADPGQMSQVVLNLCVNARDAMPNGGVIELKTDHVVFNRMERRGEVTIPPGEYVVLAISDTGVGIDPAAMPKIFDPFFTTKEHGKGTGLGLSTVFGIVSQSKGHIVVHSELSRGTTFEILLPALAPASVESGPALVADLPGVALTAGGVTVLVAEDDPRVREFVVSVLRRQEYIVIEAVDGADGLAKAERYGDQIDLILTDVKMPTMSGPEMIATIRRGRPNIKVVFMSGYTDVNVLARDGFEESTRFLQKPVTIPMLLQAIRLALNDVQSLDTHAVSA